MTVIALGLVLAVVLVLLGVRWLVTAGISAGDEPDDAVTRIADAGDGPPRLTVINPGCQPVIVGMTARRHWSFGLNAVRSHLVIRPAHWRERRQHDRGASLLLGAVEPGREAAWDLPVPPGPLRIVVILGQDRGRLRVHEHLTASGYDPGLTFVLPDACRPLR